MELDRVTITGADDSVNPADLLNLSDEFPFVEWAILFSPKHRGSPRWPSADWLTRLRKDAGPMKLSAHLCGGWVRDLLQGKFTFSEWFSEYFDDYQRVQLNFHAEPVAALPVEFVSALLGGCMCRDGSVERQFIFQIDGVNDGFFDSVRQMAPSHDFVPLFDCSHGAGVLPGDGWPKAEYQDAAAGRSIRKLIYHGYAGGLGPETLETQIPLIGAAAGNSKIWIDMETRVRSHDDHVFDLAKVRRCLEICKPWIVA